MKVLIAAALAMVATSAPALAYDASWTRYDEADANLSAAYDAAIAHRQGADRVALRNDERVWISERNKSCGFETKGSCAIGLTQQRTHYLISRLPSPASYRFTPSKRLMGLENALNEACHAPGQDIDGPLCGRRQVAYDELKRRGFPVTD